METRINIQFSFQLFYFEKGIKKNQHQEEKIKTQRSYVHNLDKEAERTSVHSVEAVVSASRWR